MSAFGITYPQVLKRFSSTLGGSVSWQLKYEITNLHDRVNTLSVIAGIESEPHKLSLTSGGRIKGIRGIGVSKGIGGTYPFMLTHVENFPETAKISLLTFARP